MPFASERLVPKIHPATRPVEPEDPMTLHAVMAEGDPEVMLQCLVQEFAWMGWDTERILALFRDPFYPALHQLGRRYGEAGIRARVTALLGRMGVFCCQEEVRDEPEADEPETELIQLGLPKQGLKVPKGDSHAEGL
jgi:hypothetical protein